jgi:hypothetical protein
MIGKKVTNSRGELAILSGKNTDREMRKILTGRIRYNNHFGPFVLPGFCEFMAYRQGDIRGIGLIRDSGEGFAKGGIARWIQRTGRH